MFYRETFFRPPVIQQITWTMPAEPYNCTRHLLKQTQTGCVFVPIRTMQYLAVIDAVEIIFIDAIGNYTYQSGQGGRVIQLAWQNFQPQARESLTDPVACTIVYYLQDAEIAMKRLIREFSEALTQLKQRAQPLLPQQTAHIIPLSRYFG